MKTNDDKKIENLYLDNIFKESKNIGPSNLKMDDIDTNRKCLDIFSNDTFSVKIGENLFLHDSAIPKVIYSVDYQNNLIDFIIEWKDDRLPYNLFKKIVPCITIKRVWKSKTNKLRTINIIMDNLFSKHNVILDDEESTPLGKLFVKQLLRDAIKKYNYRVYLIDLNKREYKKLTSPSDFADEAYGDTEYFREIRYCFSKNEL